MMNLESVSELSGASVFSAANGRSRRSETHYSPPIIDAVNFQIGKSWFVCLPVAVYSLAALRAG
jgi:hypothetical protein